MRTLWEQDSLQFPRLLAELRGIGLTEEQYTYLIEEMSGPYDTPEEMRELIDELFDRAEASWQRIKDRTFERIYKAQRP